LISARIIRKGIESGPGIPAEQVFERLQRKYGRVTNDASPPAAPGILG
jgi:hypothetical protein